MAVLIPAINTIFLLSPGTGSTSLSQWFIEEMGGEWILDPVQYKHATPTDIRMTGIDLDKHIVATTTRHPLDFYISQYHKKKTWPGDSPEFRLAKDNTFEVFLRRFLDSTPSGYLHPIFLSAAEVVFRKECLENDVNYFLKALNTEITAKLPQVNVSENLSHEFSDWYTKDSINLVIKKHKEHFNRFKYTSKNPTPSEDIEISKYSLSKAELNKKPQGHRMVLEGKNRWLYLSDDSNKVVTCTNGKFTPTDFWMEAWYKESIRRQQESSNMNAVSLSCIIPNTHSAVPTYLPDAVRPSPRRPAVVLSESIADIYYPLVEFSDEDCFLSNDSHYSQYGAYTLYKYICKKLNLPFRALEKSDFEHKSKIGDLGSKLTPVIKAPHLCLKEAVQKDLLKGKSSRVFYSSVEVTGKFEVYKNKDTTTKNTALIFGDSYSYSLVPFLNLTFETVTLIHATKVAANLVNKIRPTHVFYLNAERFVVQSPETAYDCHLNDYKAKLAAQFHANVHTPPPQYNPTYFEEMPWLVEQAISHDRVYNETYGNPIVNSAAIYDTFRLLLGREISIQNLSQKLKNPYPLNKIIQEITTSPEFIERLATS